MSESTLDIILRSKKTGSGGADATKELNALDKQAKSTGGSLDQVGKIAGGVFKAGVLAAAGAAIEAVKSTLDYAKASRDAAAAVGIDTQQMQKLIQVADDAGVSQGELTSALQLATKNGFAPSIESLANLADRVNQIQDPTQRAAEYAKIFGRNWAALNPILKQGGDAIRANADEAQRMGLIMSDEALDGAEKLRVGLDNLGDRLEGVKLQLASGLIPVLNDAITGFDFLTEAIGKVETKDEQYRQAIIQATIALGPNSEAVRQLSAAYTEYLIQQKVAIERFAGYAGAVDTAVLATQRYRDVIGEQMLPTLSDLDTALISAATSTDALTTAELYQASIKDLPADAAIEIARSLGLLNDNNYNVMKGLQNARAEYAKTGDIKAYERAIHNLNNELDAIKTDIKIRISLATPDLSGDRNIPRAGGGPVYPNEPVRVNEIYRERFVPYQAGSIMPANNYTTNIAHGAIVINPPMGMNINTLADTIMNRLSRETRQQVISGAAWAGG